MRRVAQFAFGVPPMRRDVVARSLVRLGLVLGGANSCSRWRIQNFEDAARGAEFDRREAARPFALDNRDGPREFSARDREKYYVRDGN